MQGEQQGYIFPHVVKITTGTEMESVTAHYVTVNYSTIWFALLLLFVCD